MAMKSHVNMTLEFVFVSILAEYRPSVGNCEPCI